MSLVALALLAQGLSFSRDFLLIAAVVLGFDLLIGLTTYMRLMAAGNDDLRAMHGMSRIRHGYTQIAPTLTPYFTAPIHDDVTSLMAGYGNPPPGEVGGVMYMLSTTLGMVGLIVCMLSGVAAGTVALAVGTSGRLALAAVPVIAVVFFVVLASWTARTIREYQNALPVLVPSPDGGEQAS